MKRTYRVLSLVLVIVLALGLAGCGSSKNSSFAQNVSAPAAAPVPAPAYESFASYDSAAADYGMEEPAEAEMTAGLSGRNGEIPSGQSMSEKIIYNAEATLETTDFDAAVDRIVALVNELDGYMESTSISGSNYSSIARGNSGVRSAYYTIRVPSQHFARLTGSLSDLGNVPYSRTYSRNVTQEYYDVESRLEAYRTQEKRLLEMLSIAETVEDMLAIQRELTEVQYELDSLQGTLRYYDNQVGYSTVNLTVQEVREYTPEPTVKLSYWERMAKEFRQSLKATGEFFTDLFLWFVTSLPWLIPLAVFIALIVWLIRRRLRRNPERAKARAERRAARKEAKAQRRAARKQKKALSPSPEEKKE